MKRKRVVVMGLSVSIGIWVLAISVGFLVGYWIRRFNLLNSLETLPTEGRGAVGSDALERRAVMRKYGAAGSTNSELRRGAGLRPAMEGVLRVSEEAQRQYAIGVVMSGLDASEIGDVGAFVEGLPPGPRLDEFALALLGRWGMLDGRSSLAFALERVPPWNREHAIAVTLEGWAHTDGDLLGSGWLIIREASLSKARASPPSSMG